MWGRLLGLLAGLALCGEAIALWRPETIGGLASPSLGPFTPYRLIIAILAGAMGLAVIVASLLRTVGDGKGKPAAASGALAFDAAQAEAQPLFRVMASEPGPAAGPGPADAGHEPEAIDPFPAEAPQAHVIHLAHAQAAEAPAVAEEPAPYCELPPAAAASPDGRGTFLTAIDAGDQMRAANRWDDALELYDGALALARRSYAAAPADPTARRDLALALTHVGDVHDREGRLDSALSLHEESLNLRRALAAEAPGDIAAQRALSTGLERMADTREARGHRSRARDLCRERLPLAERLAALAPSDAGLAQDLVFTRERLKELDEASEI